MPHGEAFLRRKIPRGRRGCFPIPRNRVPIPFGALPISRKGVPAPHFRFPNAVWDSPHAARGRPHAAEISPRGSELSPHAARKSPRGIFGKPSGTKTGRFSWKMPAFAALTHEVAPLRHDGKQGRAAVCLSFQSLVPLVCGDSDAGHGLSGWRAQRLMHRRLHGQGGLAVPVRGGCNPPARDRRNLSPLRRPRLAHCGWCLRRSVRSLTRRCQLGGFAVSSKNCQPCFCKP